MTYIDRYAHYLDSLQTDIAKAEGQGKLIVFGYTSDLDILLEWDVEAFNALLAEHLRELPEAVVRGTIGSLEDFAWIVSSCLVRGLGGEVEITNPEVCEFLEATFKGSHAIGGTAAQGSAALGAIGMPVVIHLTDSSKEVRRLYCYPNVFTVDQGELVPVRDGDDGSAPVKHMVLQYGKGDVIRLGDRQFAAPESNRLILDYDDLNTQLPIQSEFLRYIEENAKDFYSYSISGFNLIVNPGTLYQRLAELEPHYARVKKENPDCIIYLEAAHYTCPDIQMAVFERMGPQVDILGMNEEELVDFTARMGVATDPNSLESVLQGLDAVISKYSVKGLVLHTKDYALYCGQKLTGVNLEKGLTIGNLMAATKARIGVYGTIEDCRETLAWELSPIGLQFAEELAGLETKHYTCLVPARYNQHPKSTIGLGDTFVAGVQMGFII